MDFQSNDPKDSKTSSIVDLASFRQKKEIETQLGQGRKPLYVSHMSGKVTGSPHLKSPASTGEDFGDRVQRIKVSLEKINRLLGEIKKISVKKSSPQ